VVARCNTGTRTKHRGDLPLHGRYVDRTRILIQPQAGIHARGMAGK